MKRESHSAASGAKKIDDNKPKKLSSMLFKLAVSADPDHFAKNHDIFMDKNRTRVFIFFEPSTSDQEIKKILNDHKIMIEKGTSHMIRGLMAVEHLIPLSKENAVRSIRLPNKLIRAREINP